MYMVYYRFWTNPHESGNIMATTAEKLRQRRAELGKTQSEVAQSAGMSTVQYNGYENERHEPSELTMKRLAKALRIKAETLWGDPEDYPDSIPGMIAILRERIAEELELKVSQVSISINVQS